MTLNILSKLFLYSSDIFQRIHQLYVFNFHCFTISSQYNDNGYNSFGFYSEKVNLNKHSTIGRCPAQLNQSE